MGLVIDGKVVSPEEFEEMSKPVVMQPGVEYHPAFQIFAPGSLVYLGGSNLKGRILSVNIKPDGVTYLIGYLDNSNHWHEVWLPEEELAAVAPETKATIGFKGEE